MKLVKPCEACEDKSVFFLLWETWTHSCLFCQDLSKKDSALLKLGNELRDLEKVQEELEKKEQELRSERNTVTRVKKSLNV